ncbi:hypothetical protein [Longimicrobium terrae]|uniref:Uncharacterized protein n=2 Tax=Longimicrobium terrae TaxID=1639882 RepID=A0A841GMM5_9BACT|nr:hypothetical protein [Longimicrobium terrae]MBB6070041.1 hypothetical protein [Longimicrobium terrae]NNC32947.1 hypothetical protein [Longimicrobium terrae]
MADVALHAHPEEKVNRMLRIGSAELETMWRLAGRRTLREHAERLDSQIQELRPRVLAVMVEMVLLELERGPEVAPTAADIAVLCASQDTRVRLLGLRLLGNAEKS